MTRPLVLCNPRAGGGKAARRWPALEADLRAILGPIDSLLPGSSEETATAAGHAARAGQPLVLVGGDGTLNAAMAGIGPVLDAGLPCPPIALVSLGSGGDFCRALGLMPGDLASARALAAGQFRRIDLGRIDLSGADGQPVTRWFLTVANAGLSARVVQAMQASHLPALIGPKLAYVPFVLRELFRSPGSRLVLRPDSGPQTETRALIVSVANTAYFAAGMGIAPPADPRDGQFDIVTIRQDRSVRPWHLRHLYTGRILSHPAVTHQCAGAMTLSAADASPLPLDADGELMGFLPARLTCLPGALAIALPPA